MKTPWLVFTLFMDLHSLASTTEVIIKLHWFYLGLEGYQWALHI